jgi:hypothetical protein
VLLLQCAKQKCGKKKKKWECCSKLFDSLKNRFKFIENDKKLNRVFNGKDLKLEGTIVAF